MQSHEFNPYSDVDFGFANCYYPKYCVGWWWHSIELDDTIYSLAKRIQLDIDEYNKKHDSAIRWLPEG